MSSQRFILKNARLIGVTTGLKPALVSGTMAASITGPTTDISAADNACFQVAWTSSNAVGTITVEGSVDGITFDALTFSPVLTQPNSDNGAYLINLADIPFPLIRLVYTRTSGTGNMTVSMSAKGA